MPLMTPPGADMMGMVGVASIVSSLSLPTLMLFEFTWVVGMAAMMFPAMIPVLVFYNRLVAKAESSPRTVRLAGTRYSS